MAEIVERRYVSRYSTPTFGLVVHKAGVAADADANDVDVRLIRESDQVVIFDRQSTRTALGTYHIVLGSADTASPGFYTLRWSYLINTVAQTYEGYLEVGDTAPAYDALTPEMQELVESAWMRFADLFDSPAGGPHLQTYFQAHFGRHRVAQLLNVALNKLNRSSQPITVYTLDQFPLAKWSGVLEQALYIEMLRHLVRSYVEQPNEVGVNVAYLDRRDYFERWSAVLREEEAGFRSELEVFKMAHMGLGRPRVLVGGGIFGNLPSPAAPLSVAARPRLWASYYS